jgi:hypothetical protein
MKHIRARVFSDQFDSGGIKPEEGLCLEGELLSKRTVEGQYGEQMRITVNDVNLGPVSMFCPTFLRSQIEDQKISEGMTIYIKCFGKSEKGAWLFNVGGGYPEEDEGSTHTVNDTD